MNNSKLTTEKVNNKNNSIEIGDMISGLRRLAGLSQSELASQIQITKLALHKIEKNVNKPKDETLTKIAKYFGITVEQLKMLVDRINTNDYEKRRLTDKLFSQLIIKNE